MCLHLPQQTKAPEAAKPAAPKAAKTTKAKGAPGLFDSDDEEEDLFAAVSLYWLYYYVHFEGLVQNNCNL